MKKIVMLPFLILLPIVVVAQTAQFVNLPLQASFENESFFYNPNPFSPVDIGPLTNIEPGFYATNPLNKLSQNPAWLPDLNGHDLYAYVHVRSRNLYKAKNNPSTYNPCPYCDFVTSNNANPAFLPIPYPGVYNPYVNANGHRLEQQPFLSASIIGYPFKNKKIFAGVTYQAIISKEQYYAYPSYTYPQNSTAAYYSAGATSPTEFFKQNTLKQTGNLLTFYGGYRLSQRAIVGLRINTTIFQRNGGYGNHNKNIGIYSFGNVSPADVINNTPDLLTEQRSQHYRHLSFDIGGRYKLSQRLTAMAHLGYLIGSGDENLNTSLPTYIENGTYNSGQYYELSQSIKTSLDSWSNSGHTFSGGLAFQYNLSGTGHFRLFYETYNSRTGLSPSARTQYSIQRLIQNPAFSVATQIYSQQTKTLHSGDGSENAWSHRAGLFYEWSPVHLVTLNTGVQYGHYSRNIHTIEQVDQTGLTVIQNIDTTGAASITRQPINNQQNVDWRNRIREHRFQIPFMAQIKLLGKLNIWGGFNEQIESIRIRDNLLNPNPQPVYTVLQSNNGNLTTSNDTGTPIRYNKYHTVRYRFTLMSGVSYEVNKRITLHMMILPYDHRYSFNRTRQTSGLVWQAGFSIYP